MNLLKKIIFKRDAQSLQKLVLSLCGYLSIGHTKGTVKSITNENYYINKRKIDKLYNSFQELIFNKGEDIPYYILFKLYQIIQLYNLSEFNTASEFIKDIKNKMLKYGNYLPITTKKWINIYIKLIDYQIDNNAWLNEVELEHNIFFIAKQERQNIIDNCYAQYDLHETNSEEHLNISREHLDNYIQLAQLNIKDEEGNILSKEEKQHGKYLLQMMVQLYEQALNDVEKDLLLKSNVLLEIIKLKYYLGENKKNVFEDMLVYCSYHIKLNNFDPIGYIIGDYNASIIKPYLPITQQTSFKNYLKTFYLEIHLNKNDQVFFNLKQLDNFCASSLEERLKVIDYIEK